MEYKGKYVYCHITIDIIFYALELCLLSYIIYQQNVFFVIIIIIKLQYLYWKAFQAEFLFIRNILI